MKAVATYRLQARNHAGDSPNRMHDPEYARTLGFAGGIVPGVDVYSYLTRPVLEVWGLEWLRHGGMEVRFVKPVYEADHLAIEAETDGEGRLVLSATREEGEVCATGRAELRPSEAPPDPETHRTAPLPEPRPPAEEAAFRSRPVLGSLEVVVTEEDAARQRYEVGEQLELYAREGIVHPGHLLRFADRILAENFTLPPWMHVSSNPRHFAPAKVGEPLSVRANLVDLFERKGHRFVQLDVLILGADRPVARVMPYTAIYRPAF